MNQADAIVSSDSENLILVNENDQEVGVMRKLDCHLDEGVLHRAFSIFIFNEKCELLLQKRSQDKFLWPLYWSNTCCSHPREGESVEEAIHRRLEQELGFDTHLEFLYKFIYKAAFEDKGTEHELCHVWVGRYSGDVKVNSNEIDEWRFVSREDLDKELVQTPGLFTPWMKMEWDRIGKEFPQYLSGETKSKE